MVVMLFLCIACGGNQKPEVSNEIVDNRGETPRLRVNEITTLISDSGVTRYRITAPKWLVFDKAEEPYWDFPEGLHLESFDEQFHIEAEVDCRRARYYEQRKLWQLDDSVRAMNFQGNRFATQQLFWGSKYRTHLFRFDNHYSPKRQTNYRRRFRIEPIDDTLYHSQNARHHSHRPKRITYEQ